MKRLDRYLISTTLKLLFLCEFAGVAIYSIIEFFEHLDVFATSLDNFLLSLLYISARVPYSATLILPLAFLISMLITFIIMVRNNEIMIIRSSGISTLFFIRPLFYLSCLLTILTFFLKESFAPQAYRVSEFIYKVKIKKEEPFISVKNDRIWLKKGNKIARIEYLDAKKELMKEITVLELSPDYTIKKRFDAKEGIFTGSTWVFTDVVERIFEENGSAEKKYYPLLLGLVSEPPDTFRNLERNPEEMSFKELNGYIERLRENGYNAKKYLVDLYNKISFPFINVIMVMIACSIGLRYSKARNIARGLFSGIVIGASYWFFHSVCLSLGYSEIFPPVFSAWLTNIVFFSTGIIGILTLRN